MNKFKPLGEGNNYYIYSLKNPNKVDEIQKKKEVHRIN